MEQGFEKRRVLRRSSAQFYVTAEEHIKNEMKHERHLTETSRLTSSWANLRLTGTDKPEYSDCGFSSPGSSGSSPVGHRPNSFSGPLVISVTCSSGGGISNTNASESRSSVAIATAPGIVSFSRSASCYPSPVASPVSSRVQCYSPSIGLPSSFAAKKRTASVSSGSSASPLIFGKNRGKKRTYKCLRNNDMVSSAEASRESSPESPRTFCRSGKILRSSEGAVNHHNVLSHLGSPRDSSQCTPPVSTPSSPILPVPFSMRMGCNCPSTTSLPSLAHSTSSAMQSCFHRLPVLPSQPPDFTPSELKPRSPSSLSCPESAVACQIVSKCPEGSSERGNE
ncbi:unnamed protein product [Hydatigera taeniaeformis]|uniref:NYAP_N domain-containing protein n=1 Tax=Hydatigena taeniaeformis TaxID=6205 RepID=A0A0R3WKV0_HYDTA|nr:unnamed protein product [Hydatigera taeniaeformis]